MSENQDIRRLADLCKKMELDENHPLRRLVNALAPDDSYNHDLAEQELPTYVMDEFLGRNVARRYPKLHRHLLNCQQCAELHITALSDLSEEVAPTKSPPPNLAFLPNSSQMQADVLADLRTATQRAITYIVEIEWPALREEMSVVTRVFFRQLDRLGNDFMFQASVAQALGFGGNEVLTSQRLLAASYHTNQILYNSLSDITTPNKTQISDLAQTAARQAATEMKLTEDERERFVGAYLAWLRDNSD